MRGRKSSESDGGGNRMKDVKVEKAAGTGRTGRLGVKRKMREKDAR